MTINHTESVSLPVLPTRTTWRDLVESFLSEYRGASRASYSNGIRQFLTFSNIPMDSTLTNITDETLVKSWRDSMLDARQSPYTINSYLAAIRGLYRHMMSYARRALRSGNVTVDQVSHITILIEGVMAVRKVRTPNTPARIPATVEQCREIIESIPADSLTDIRDKAIISLLIGTGLRRIELVRAIRADLVHQGGQLLLKVQRKGMHSKHGFVVIQPDVEKLIRPWLAQSPCQQTDNPLFCSLSNRRYGNPLTARSISRIVRDRLDVLNLSHISTHGLRHSFASAALSSGQVELRDLQQCLGHSSVVTTEIYTHTTSRLEGLPERVVADLIFADIPRSDTT